MKLTTGILAMAMMAGGAWAQTPDAIDNARSAAKALQQQQTSDTNAAAVPAAKPAPGAPAPAVKPAVIPGAKPAVAKPAAKPAAEASANNQLQAVKVATGADNIQIEISSSQAVTPRLTKLDSPARILVELPGTADATPKNHIAIGTGGVKGVRIGMDGKTPPTTRVVVDLEKACAYELSPGSSGKLVLTLHTQAVAQSNPAPAKTAPVAQPQTAKSAPPAAKPQAVPAIAKSNPAPAKTSAPAAQPQTVAKTAPAPAKAQPVAAKPAVASKPAVAASAAPKQLEKQQTAKETKAAAPAPADASKSADASKQQPKPEDKKWAMNGKRDPFFSPVVQAQGSGCSTGKKCLEIGNINLRGVVKSDSGFIAVVTNNLNKAYFLRENDPVFNGYVVKITGDSVVFQETVEDKLGKPFTREVVKRIFTPAV
jgi:Tfp pilus assembly protein PilP